MNAYFKPMFMSDNPFEVPGDVPFSGLKIPVSDASGTGWKLTHS